MVLSSQAPDGVGATASASPPGASLRIAIVTEYYYPHLGGICEHVHHVAGELRRRGHHADIVTSRIDGTPPTDGVLRIGRSQPIFFNGSQARVTLGRGLREAMRTLLRDGGYDLVHVHAPLTPTLPMLAIEASPVPVIGTFHTYFEQSLCYAVGRRYFQRYLDRLSAAVAVSPSTVEALARYFRADWRVLPNGVDPSVFRPDAPRPAALRTDVPVILFVGRFDPRNGLDTLIEAFRRVRSPRRPAQLVVVGGGPLRGYYQRLARGDRDVTFVGPMLDERPGFFAHAAVYACPTTIASFGITLLEAMASATPIVCSDIPGFRDVVQHEREALMVPRGDPRALADGIVRLLDDAGLAERLGRTGRERAFGYAWPRVTDEILAVYDSLLRRTPVAT